MLLGALLLLTTWFQAWYVVWPLALAAALPEPRRHLEVALLSLAGARDSRRTRRRGGAGRVCHVAWCAPAAHHVVSGLVRRLAARAGSRLARASPPPRGSPAESRWCSRFAPDATPGWCGPRMSCCLVRSCCSPRGFRPGTSSGRSRWQPPCPSLAATSR